MKVMNVKRAIIASILAILLCGGTITAYAETIFDCEHLPGECIEHSIFCLEVIEMNNCYVKCLALGGACFQYDCLGEWSVSTCEIEE